MIVKEILGGMVEMRGVSRYPLGIHEQHAEHARARKQEKTKKQVNYHVPKKCEKPKRGESKIKIAEKNVKKR